jgi:hypothetical protein
LWEILAELILFLLHDFSREEYGNKSSSETFNLSPSGLSQEKTEELKTKLLIETKEKLLNLISAVREVYKAYRTTVKELLYL